MIQPSSVTQESANPFDFVSKFGSFAFDNSNKLNNIYTSDVHSGRDILCLNHKNKPLNPLFSLNSGRNGEIFGYIASEFHLRLPLLVLIVRIAMG
ncbi:hypothetical protein H5410_006410 [Solanum commersonii]|uniref:Uncharacterized protein n=1 Tax=Solanum commersonii TaxID=4109 RepID=A0A9J6A9R7_SOLCO|nr:hypothetical protein H5410_006410 [Solanum commersonii]